jgi:transposase InsO family protein
MCGLLGVDRRRFYEWQAAKSQPLTAREEQFNLVVDKVTQFHQASDGTYGYRRILPDLIDAGMTVNHKTVAKAMKTAGIQGISPRSFKVTTRPGPDQTPAPDLVARNFDMGAPDLAWFSDITYLAAGRQWAYLCSVKDGHTKRVLGRMVAPRMTADLVEHTLRQAVTLRGALPGKVIFHADRGSQYTSKQVSQLAADLPILRSMGATGVAWDNAMAESFWSTFKHEFYYRHVFTSIEQLRRETYVWIDSWYNARRRHSAIGYLSPLEYEQRLVENAQTN